MKKNSLFKQKGIRIWLVLCSVMLSASIGAQTYTYTISPTGYTSVPTSNITNGSITLQGNLLQVKAVILDKSLIFSIKKKDDSAFSNNITIQIRQNSATGTILQEKDYGGGYFSYDHGFGTINFTGTKKFVVVLKSKGSTTNYWYYTNPVTVTVTETNTSKPTVTTTSAQSVTYSTALLNGYFYPNGLKTTYYFEYGTSRNSLNNSTQKVVESNIDGKQYVARSVKDLTPLTTYYFRLVAYNSAGESKGDIVSFETIDSNQPPVKPQNPSPSNGATNQETNGTLSWSCTDPDLNPLSYKVYLGTSTSNMSLYKSTTDRYCSYSLNPNTKYYWYVIASDGKLSTTGPTWNFTTKAGSTSPFSDCTSEEDCGGKEYQGEIYQAAVYLSKLGIIEGISGKLEPNMSVTRAQLAKMALFSLYKGSANVPSTLVTDYFPSIYPDLQDKTSYYYRAAKALLYLEYKDGKSPFDRNRSYFNPANTISRRIALKVLCETFNITPSTATSSNPFTDFLPSEDFYGYARKCY